MTSNSEIKLPRYRIVTLDLYHWGIEVFVPGNEWTEERKVITNHATWFSAEAYKVETRKYGFPDRWMTAVYKIHTYGCLKVRSGDPYDEFKDSVYANQGISVFTSKEECKRVIDEDLNFQKRRDEAARIVREFKENNPPEEYP